jgi:hypothetical protein
MLIQPELVYPYAHKVLFEGKPYFMHCKVGNCRMCERIECAKNLKVIDDIVKRLFRKIKPFPTEPSWVGT